MAEPTRKTKDVVALYRMIPKILPPHNVSAAGWRRLVRRLPAAVNCRDTIIRRTTALPFSIRPREMHRAAEHIDEINYYTDMLQNVDNEDFHLWTQRMLEDALDLPIGGGSEITRWNAGYTPFTTTDEGKRFYETRGVVHNLYHIDGSTLTPTGNPEMPLRQLPPEASTPVTLHKDLVLRIYYAPRPELTWRGYGMPPPEAIFLAMALVARGDNYYAKLLVDVPEAGVLDLGDMEADAAQEWVNETRALLLGDDALKIPVLYEHTTPAKFVPFGRPPSEIMFGEITNRYMSFVACGYGITLRDVGLDEDRVSLAGQIRSDRSSRRNGFALAKSYIKGRIDQKVLPPYLEFLWIDRDEETLIARARARLANAQAAKQLVGRPVMTVEEWRRQMMEDGLYTGLDLTLTADDILPPADQQPEGIDRGEYDDTRDTLGSTEPVPAEEGGRTEVRSYADALREGSRPVHLRRILRALSSDETADKPLMEYSGYSWWEIQELNLDEAIQEICSAYSEGLYEFGFVDSFQSFSVSNGTIGAFLAYWHDRVGASIKAQALASLVTSEGDVDEALELFQEELEAYYASVDEELVAALSLWLSRELAEGV